MSGRQRALKTIPTRGLGIHSAPERFKNVDPNILPSKVWPVSVAAASPMLGRLDRLPCFFHPSGRKEAPRDFRGDPRHCSCCFLILLDERVDIADVAAGLVKDTDHRSTTVVAALEDRRSQGHEPPEQVEGFLRVRLGHPLDDCPPLGIEVAREGSDALPVHKRPGSRYGRDPLAHFLRKFAWALCAD